MDCYVEIAKCTSYKIKLNNNLVVLRKSLTFAVSKIKN